MEETQAAFMVSFCPLSQQPVRHDREHEGSEDCLPIVFVSACGFESETELSRIDCSLINHAARFADRLEPDLPIVDFDEHEVIVLIKAHFANRAIELDPASAGFPSCPRNKVLDTLLGFGPLIDVVVSRKYGIDVVAGEERFQLVSQFHV